MRSVAILCVLSVVCSFAAHAQVWQDRTELINARYEFDMVSTNSHMYAIGGKDAPNSLERFSSNVWTSMANLPVPQEAHSAAIYGSKIYTFGNYGPDDTVQIYNINTNTWSAGPSLPVAMYWTTATSSGGNIYVFGGYNGAGTYYDTVYILNTSTLTWSSGTSCPDLLYNPSSALYGSNIYVFSRDKAYRYTPGTDSWVTLADRPVDYSNSVCARAGDQIYLMGGDPGDVTSPVADTWIYEVAGDYWWRGPDMQNARLWLGATYYNDGIRAVGGRLAGFVTTDANERLTPLTGQGGIQVNITSDMDPIPVELGGSFHYDLDIAFNMYMTGLATIASYALLPSGFTYGPIFQATLPYGEMMTIDINNLVQNIPVSAPTGTYQFIIEGHTLDNAFSGEDSVELQVTAAMAGQRHSATSWAYSGFEQLTQSDERGEPQTALPAEYALLRAYPNPFNPAATITVALPDAADLSVVVYNPLGKHVAELAHGYHSAGLHTFTFDGRPHASGLYLVRASVPGKFNSMQKIALIK